MMRSECADFSRFNAYFSLSVGHTHSEKKRKVKKAENGVDSANKCKQCGHERGAAIFADLMRIFARFFERRFATLKNWRQLGGLDR
jgi:ribosomal protein S14